MSSVQEMSDVVPLSPQTDFHRGHKKPGLGSHRPGVITLVLSFTLARGWGHTLLALDTAVASLQERWGHTCQELSELAALVNNVRHTWHHR